MSVAWQSGHELGGHTHLALDLECSPMCFHQASGNGKVKADPTVGRCAIYGNPRLRCSHHRQEHALREKRRGMFQPRLGLPPTGLLGIPVRQNFGQAAVAVGVVLALQCLNLSVGGPVGQKASSPRLSAQPPPCSGTTASAGRRSSSKQPTDIRRRKR